ncbi:DUF3618 domain-containing protein [Polymorphospora rubra]|uniref:DUF3618 domain-containing protein n=1 Tax=Polymorphospora rubra TaxID=338584 RepID=UPI00340B0419
MTAGNGSGDVQALRAEIQQTRAELGETVQALAAKADVKARLRESADQTKQKVREQAAHTAEVVRGSVHDAGESARRHPLPWAAVAFGALAAVVVLIVVQGRRR